MTNAVYFGLFWNGNGNVNVYNILGMSNLFEIPKWQMCI